MWNPYGMDAVYVESMWNPYGIHVESIWNPCGIHMESILIPCGIHVDIPSFHVEFGHSITIPCGIQMEWRTQNEWDPTQNIFHMDGGIHMDSTWIPCGMWGGSKDLHAANGWDAVWPTPPAPRRRVRCWRCR